MKKNMFVNLIETLSVQDKDFGKLLVDKNLTPEEMFNLIQREVKAKSHITTIQNDDLYMAVILKIFAKKKYSPVLVRNAIMDELRKYHREFITYVNGKRKHFINLPPDEKEEVEYVEEDEN